MKGYVLTIDPPAGPRRESIVAELSRAPFPWEFVEGVRKDDQSLSWLYSPLKNLLFCKRSLAPAEIACYAGHRLIWQRIVASPDPYGLVFEDDAGIPDWAAFGRALEDVVGYDYVKFFDFAPKSVALSKTVGSTELVMHRMIASGAVCYLISRSAAQRLLSRKNIYRAADEDISRAWEFGFDVWSVWPNPVVEKHFCSNISEGRQPKERNVLRSLYGNILQAHKQIRMASVIRRGR
ncbi:MAG: glycosyltransferase family 25 protein [Hyphomicrobiales bacterium]|nr:glycosyltransferase family 25 protein [Hyphomicrobiales bacterium]